MEDECTSFVEGNDMDIYEPVIAELKAQIEECERVIATLEMMRSKGVSAAIKTSSSGATSGSPIVFRNDEFFGITTAEATKKYLMATKKTATAKVITEALTAGGWKSFSKNPVENLRTIISRHQLFALVNGEFGLAEWYPGRKAAKRQGAASNLNEESYEVTVSHGADSSLVEGQRRESA